MPIEELVSMALKDGLFAALFIFTFIHFLKEAKSREESWKGMYSQLSTQTDEVLIKINVLENKAIKTEEVSKELAELKVLVRQIDSIIREKMK